MSLSYPSHWGEPLSRMTSRTDVLEEELQRNLKLRRELGAEVRLELVTTDAAVKRDVDYPLTVVGRVIGAAWITAGFVGLALAALIAVWLT